MSGQHNPQVYYDYSHLSTSTPQSHNSGSNARKNPIILSAPPLKKLRSISIVVITLAMIWLMSPLTSDANYKADQNPITSADIPSAPFTRIRLFNPTAK